MQQKRPNERVQAAKSRQAQPSTPQRSKNNKSTNGGTRAPVSVGVSKRTGTPMVRDLAPGHILVSNREIVSTISGTAASGLIAATATIVTVALSDTNFAWLSKFSGMYDKYKFHNLDFEFIPALPTTTGGNVCLYFDSDSADPIQTFQVAASQFNARTGPIWAPLRLPINKEMLHTQLWFATATSAGNAFPATGRLAAPTTPVLLLNGSAAGSVVIGYLWAKYDVELAYPTTV